MPRPCSFLEGRDKLTRLRPSKRERYRVAIFGSARAQPGTYVYEVRRAAAAFAAMACDIVTGGGPGLMQAANQGANEAGAPGSVDSRRAAIRAGCESLRRQAFEHETFFTRLHHFVIASDGVCRRARRHRHRARDADDLATASGPACGRRAAHPRRQDLERTRRLRRCSTRAWPSRVPRIPTSRSAWTLRMKRLLSFATCTGTGRIAGNVNKGVAASARPIRPAIVPAHDAAECDRWRAVLTGARFLQRSPNLGRNPASLVVSAQHLTRSGRSDWPSPASDVDGFSMRRRIRTPDARTAAGRGAVRDRCEWRRVRRRPCVQRGPPERKKTTHADWIDPPAPLACRLSRRRVLSKNA